jgi:hypothetical protein
MIQMGRYRKIMKVFINFKCYKQVSDAESENILVYFNMFYFIL